MHLSPITGAMKQLLVPIMAVSVAPSQTDQAESDQLESDQLDSDLLENTRTHSHAHTAIITE